MADLTKFDMFIDGAFVQASDGATFQSYDPSTGAPWAEIPATAEDVERAVAAAKRALDGPGTDDPHPKRQSPCQAR